MIAKVDLNEKNESAVHRDLSPRSALGQCHLKSEETCSKAKETTQVWQLALVEMVCIDERIN